MKKSDELKNRLIRFAINTVIFTKKLPKSTENLIFTKQIIRSSSSVGANYTEAIFAYSKQEFIHCLNISRKEINETIYWIELLSFANPSFEKEIKVLQSEALEILKIFVSSIKTAKSNV